MSESFSDTVDMCDTKPLVTFALFAYNQEMYIRDAVLGALSQTYSPLEVIISDDCSTDNTFQYIESMVSEYSGPHKIVINRNEKNLGVGAHVNLVTNMSNGALIVAAAGDDVSLPHRTLELATIWNKSSRKPWLLYSDAQVMDQFGNELDCIISPPKQMKGARDVAATRLAFVVGPTQAWDPRVLRRPRPLPNDLAIEDRVISFRAYYQAYIAYVPETLVKYRIHQANSSTYRVSGAQSYLAACIRRAIAEVNYIQVILDDLLLMPSNEESHNYVKAWMGELTWARARVRLYSTGFVSRVVSLMKAPSFGSFMYFLPVMLSPSLYANMYMIYKRMR